MAIQDKSGELNRILQHHEQERFELELGCGTRKRNATAIAIDQLDYPGVDIVGDIGEVLACLPERSIAAIRSYHVLEHLDPLGEIVQRMELVLKEGGELQIVVPHFSNPHYYSDYTHRNFFGLYSMSYLAREELFRRRVPAYGRVSTLRLDDVRLIFKSSPPFYLRHALKMVMGKVVNSSRYMQEAYEELLCWIFPCYEIDYRLSKHTPAQ